MPWTEAHLPRIVDIAYDPRPAEERRKLLAGAGYTVTTATSNFEAEDACATYKFSVAF